MLAAVLFAGSMMAADAVIAKGTTNSYDDVTVNSKNAIKMGKSGAGGNMTITVGAGATSLSFYAAAWNTEDAQKVTITAPEGVTVTPAEITVSANASLAGNGKSFTVTPEADYAFTVTLSGATAETVLTLASEKRAFVWSATYEAGAAPAVATPVISGEAEFTDSVIVTMTCSTQDADIYYTTDGTTDPKCDCSAAPEYKKPIVLKETTTIMAAAYTGNDWSAVATKTFTKVVPPANLGEKTIAEFLTLKNVKDTCVLTGVVDSIKNTTYGNLYLSDATGQVYVYGVLNAAGEAKKFAELGIDVNDTLTIKAIYSEYNNAPQVKNAIFVSVKKAQSVVPPTPQADSILFEGEHAVTWDTPLNLEAAKFAQAKAGQKIVVTYKDATDAIEFKVLDVWCHIAGSREAASLDQAEGSHTYEQFLTANAVDSIKAHGLQIIGNHFTITKVELLDGKELKEGATIWTGFFWADDWKTLEICHESFNYVDFSKYDVLRIYSEANRTDYFLQIVKAWGEPPVLTASKDAFTINNEYAELPLTDDLRTALKESDHWMIQFNKEAGEPFNVTDIVLATKISAPTNCAEAAEAALSVSGNNELYNDSAVYTIEGYVTSIATAFNPQYNNVSFWMADTQDGGNVIQAFRAVCTSAEAAPGVGDKVAVTGCLTKYNSTPEFAAGCTYEIIEKSTIVPQNLGEKTIAEFLNLKNTLDTCILTGVVDSIVNTTYGNLYLSDSTAQLYIYGVLTPAGESKKFAELGVAAGDTLTVLAIYNEYQGAPQAKNAIFVEVKKAPVADTVEVSLSEGLRYDDYVAAKGWWQIYGGDDKYVVSVSNISTTQAEGTYTVADLDADYTYLGVIEGKDTTFVAFVSGSVTLSTNAEAGSVTVEGTLIGNDNKAYHLNLLYVAPQAKDTVVLNIPEAALIDYYAAYGLYGVYGTNVEKDHQVYIALWAEDGFQGDFTEADLDFEYIGSGVIDKDGIQEIYTASITVTPGNGGDYNITADLLCYNNTLYKVTMYIPAGQAIDEVDAAQKAMKMIKGGQLIQRTGYAYPLIRSAGSPFVANNRLRACQNY